MAKTTKTKKSQQESVDKKQKVVKKNKEIKEKKIAKVKTIKETKAEETLFVPEPVSNPGPVNMDLAAAVQPLVNPLTGQLDARVKIEDLISKAPKEVQKNPNELSYTAKKWEAYLQYTKWEPEAFLAKYPGHKFKEFIQEIINFRKENA